MQTVILAMRRRSVAQGLILKLRSHSGLRAILEPDYYKAISAAEACKADTVLFEVAESGEYDVVFCLELCNRLRDNAPECRRLLLCPEQVEHIVLLTVEAVREGRIDDFLFYDVSVDYLASKLLNT